MITSGSGKIYGLIDCNRKVAGDEYNRQTEGKPQTPLSPPFMGLYSLKTVCIITLDNQQDATDLIYLLLISSTCFGRCFRPSSGAYHCNCSFWYCPPMLLLAGVATLASSNSSCSYSNKLLMMGENIARNM